jgi:hypothetical protein
MMLAGVATLLAGILVAWSAERTYLGRRAALLYHAESCTTTICVSRTITATRLRPVFRRRHCAYYLRRGETARSIPSSLAARIRAAGVRLLGYRGVEAFLLLRR